MASDRKEFPASEHKLGQLRKNGIIPFSANVISFGSIVGLLVVLPILYLMSTGGFITFAKQAFESGPVSLNNIQILNDSLVELSHFLLIIISTIFLIVVGIGMLHTKFYFSTPKVKSRNKSGVFGNISPLPLKIAAICVSFVLISLIWSISFAFVIKPVILTSNDTFKPKESISILSGVNDVSLPSLQRKFVVDDITAKIQHILGIGAPLLFLFSLSVASVSWLVVQMKFKRDHRMSRQEIEQELKEFDSPKTFSKNRLELDT
jgi:flagellar biosynthesis protein FlhB